MKCQACKKNDARIQITDLELLPDQPDDVDVPAQSSSERYLCGECAALHQLPYSAVKKAPLDIWKLLQQTAEKHRRDTNAQCPDCGMTLGEFRSKGRLGCPRDYEVFREHLDPLLQRIHNADRHVGRLPGDLPDVEPEELSAPDPGSAESTPAGAQSGAGSLDTGAQAAAMTAEPSASTADQLREQLEAAIGAEDYERAAELRDALRELED